MAKKRGLAANRGLDALLGSIKKEKAITAAALRDDSLHEGQDLDQQPSKADDKTAQSSAKPKRTISSKSARSKSASSKPTNKSTTTSTKSTDHTKAYKQNINDQVTNDDVSFDTDKGSLDEAMSLVQMDVERLQAGKYQPRRDMSESALAELASSIRQHGVMQPIVIRPLLDGEDKVADEVTHEIIAGERRWRAAKMAGQTTIPAIERALSDELAIALALIENIQREDLSVIEQAAALQRFHTEFGMSHAMIADVVGKARTTVSNLLRLNHLNETVKTYLSDGRLDMGHARALLSLSSEQQPIIADRIIDESMTVREAEKLVKSILKPEAKPKKNSVNSNPDIEKLTQQISEQLGATVKLKQKKGGKGSMEIFFHSHDELEALLAHFKS